MLGAPWGACVCPVLPVWVTPAQRLLLFDLNKHLNTLYSFRALRISTEIRRSVFRSNCRHKHTERTRFLAWVAICRHWWCHYTFWKLKHTKLAETEKFISIRSWLLWLFSFDPGILFSFSSSSVSQVSLIMFEKLQCARRHGNFLIHTLIFLPFFSVFRSGCCRFCHCHRFVSLVSLSLSPVAQPAWHEGVLVTAKCPFHCFHSVASCFCLPLEESPHCNLFC